MKAFLVLGPESSGNHFVTDILVNAGCKGDSGHRGTWEAGAENAVPQPWDNELPRDGTTPIVWRRSVPHGGDWVDIKGMVGNLRKLGYTVVAVVIVRNMFATIRSQIRRRMHNTEGEIRVNFRRALVRIFTELEKEGVPFVLQTYEALVNYPEAQDCLLKQLELPLPVERLKIHPDRTPEYFKQG
jgi:hypothetical protein